MHLLDILNELKSHTGKGSVERKMKILTNHKDNLLLKNFFFWCLDPSINYWQSKISKDEGIYACKDNTFLRTMEYILENLASREITGNKAKDALTSLYNGLQTKDQQLLEKVITRKPDVGFSVSTVNKIWPNLIYDPAYMRCKGYSPKNVEGWDFEGGNVWSDVKADGMFNNLVLAEDLKFETRSGEDLEAVVNSLDAQYHLQLGAIRGLLGEKGVKDPVLHGELVCWRDGEAIERSKSNGIINKVKLGGEFPSDVTLMISVWDYIPLHNFLKHEPYLIKYRVKRNKLKEVIAKLGTSPIQFIESKRVKSQIEAQQHFVSCLQRGLEGTVLKNGEGIWKYHTSPNQLKLKNKFRFEMRVTGFTEGEGKFASTFGSMEIESEDGLLQSAISGMKDSVRNYIHANREIFMDSVIEVEANGLFKDSEGATSLMHPRYKEHRTDRIEADTLERIIQQEIDSIVGKKLDSD